MKLQSVFIYISIILMLAAFQVKAQSDSTAYVHGLPVSEDDTVAVFPQSDLGPQENIVAVPESQIPKKVKKALRKGDQYEGWQGSTVYYDKNTHLYLVEIKRGNASRIYGLDESGRPVTYDEVSKNDDQ
ncbi:hypothetical protein [Chryseosolibacter indicus]|uniref:PepSY domain-containing protein n=1 Tax=Chryseosolibacter indicus TaxID=2782351 RepID=A0ABS5VM95_9BACT|nr:hypothetical protein [Chryseosolibacter indicus]MBT1702236.1 hypothetical protein [Chryseosolibacter indicus]